MSLAGWWRWVRAQFVPARAAVVVRPNRARLGMESLSDRVTPSVAGFGGPFASGFPGTHAGPPVGGLFGGFGGWGGFGGFGGGFGGSTGPATHLEVFAGFDPHTGETTRLTVVALDASNHQVTNYAGTVHLADTDSATTLPADYTFSASDHGRHTFAFTPGAVGSETVTATDTADGTISGTVSLTVTPAPVATHLGVFVRGRAAPGSPTGVTVVALDASNHLVRNFTGTIHLTSSDAAGVLPADYTFTAADHGFHTFQVTFNTTGSQSLTATDTADATIAGKVSINVSADAVGFGGWHRR